MGPVRREGGNNMSLKVTELAWMGFLGLGLGQMGQDAVGWAQARAFQGEYNPTRLLGLKRRPARGGSGKKVGRLK